MIACHFCGREFKDAGIHVHEAACKANPKHKEFQKEIGVTTNSGNEPIVKEAEVMPEHQMDNVKIKDLTLKQLTEIIEQTTVKAVINLEKKDYRATVVHREESAQIPDALTAFIDIDEEKKNAFGFSRELDVKGNLSPFEWWKNRDTRFIVGHADLKDWMYIEREDEKGNIVNIPIDLAQLDSEEGRWLAMSVYGIQSEKEIKMMRAGTGAIDEEGTFRKGFQLLGWAKKKKSDVYPDMQQQ